MIIESSSSDRINNHFIEVTSLALSNFLWWAIGQKAVELSSESSKDDTFNVVISQSKNVTYALNIIHDCRNAKIWIIISGV